MDVTIVTLYSDKDPNGLFLDTSQTPRIIVFTDKPLISREKTLVLKPVMNPFWEAVKLNPFNTDKFIWINSEQKFKDFHLLTQLNISDKIKFIQFNRERVLSNFITGSRSVLLEYFEGTISPEKNPDKFEIYYGNLEDAIANYYGFKYGEITILRMIMGYVSTVEGRALAYPLLKYLKPYFIPQEIVMCFYSYLLSNFYISKELDPDVLNCLIKTQNEGILKMLYENFPNLRLYTNVQPLMEKLIDPNTTLLPKKEGRIKIGIAIPVIKRDILLLDRCLNSLMKQTRKPDVITISVSGISDFNLGKYDLNILIVTTEKKQNASTNRNRAAALLPSDTDYICFFDVDDEMHPRRLEFIEQAILHFGNDFILHNFIHLLSFQDFEWEAKELQCYENALTVATYSHGLMVDPKYKIGNREIAHGHLSVSYKVWQVQKYDETIDKAGEDTEYCRRLVINKYKGTYIENKLSVYHNYRMIDSLSKRANNFRVEGKYRECYDLSIQGLRFSELSDHDQDRSDHLFYKQLVISSYYVKEMELGLKACDHIILNKVSSKSDKELARNNIRFYLKPIDISPNLKLEIVDQEVIWNSDKYDLSEMKVPISLYKYRNGYLSLSFCEKYYRFVFIQDNVITRIGKAFTSDTRDEDILINSFTPDYLY